MPYGTQKSIEHCQTTDAANAGFGTKQLSSNQGNFMAANALQDGNASNQGEKEPQHPQGRDV